MKETENEHHNEETTNHNLPHEPNTVETGIMENRNE
jgi:hypothetical protein